MASADDNVVPPLDLTDTLAIKHVLDDQAVLVGELGFVIYTGPVTDRSISAVVYHAEGIRGGLRSVRVELCNLRHCCRIGSCWAFPGVPRQTDVCDPLCGWIRRMCRAPQLLENALWEELLAVNEASNCISCRISYLQCSTHVSLVSHTRSNSTTWEGRSRTVLVV